VFFLDSYPCLFEFFLYDTNFHQLSVCFFEFNCFTHAEVLSKIHLVFQHFFDFWNFGVNLVYLVLTINVFRQYVIEVRPDVVCALIFLVLIVFHLSAEGKPSQLHANDLLLFGIDVTCVLILLALQTIESIHRAARIEINSVNFHEQILSADIVGCTHVKVLNLVFLEPCLGILNVDANLAITFVSSKDNLFDAPSC
jgi:hypothetical protein